MSGSESVVSEGGGLSATAARERLGRDGRNVLVAPAPGARFRRRIGPLADPMVVLLLVAAPTYLLVGETTDAVVAFVALVPVVAVGWVLEARAERTLDRLREMTARSAVVVRDGTEATVPAEEVVVGDLIRLAEGDVVPADARLVRLTQLSVDESSLTGESLPVAKAVAGDDVTEDASTVLAGTTVVSGEADAVVVATGSRTRYGRVGRLVEEAHSSRTPLQVALGRLVRALAVVALVFCAAVVGAELLRGSGPGAAVIAGVSLAIAAIPEEFSMVYTLYLALGAGRLARRRVLVRGLPSVETLGSTTVICTDKTGTLTEGRLALTAVWTPTEGVVDAAAPGGTASEALLDAAVRACEPRSVDPLDVAVVAHATAAGVDVTALRHDRLVADWPFDPGDKYLTHVWATDGDPSTWHVAAKGAMEGVLAHSHAEETACAAAVAANDELTASGWRVIAVAGGATPAGTDARVEHERNLQFLGLIAFSDPIRDGVDEALAQCRRAGIRVVMITGDHPATAHAIATDLDLPHELDGEDRIAVGADLDGADDATVDRLAASCNVVARARPEHKHLLVRSLRRQGEVVAMTGDGINDAPALREADIGVAMGVRGTAVAREAASIVLLDDNFTTVVAAAREGRRIFDNLTRAFAYLIAFHPPLLLAALIVPLLGQPLLLLPVHLVVLELLLHPVVSLVFQADPPAPDAMDRSPRPVGDALRLRALARPYAVGTALAAVLIGSYLVALRAWPADQARAFAFASLLASQPFLLLMVRTPGRPFWSSDRPWTPTLWAVNAMLAATTVAVVEWSPLAELLHLAPFPPAWWAAVLAVAATTAWSEPFKGRRRRPVLGTEDEGR